MDLKPENFLLDEKLNLKLVDFGFARFQKDGFSNFWGGSYSYMSPEINEQVEYNGKHADIFAMGVVLFIIVVGIFPFQAATEEDYFYNLMQSVDEHQKYWQKIEAEDLSPEFKSLIRKMFAYEGEQRPTLDEIANHPWLRKDSFSFEKTQQELQVMLKNESKYNSYSSYLTIESKEESSFEEKKF